MAVQSEWCCGSYSGSQRSLGTHGQRLHRPDELAETSDHGVLGVRIGVDPAKKKRSAAVADRYHCDGVLLLIASDLIAPLLYLIMMIAVGWKWMKCGRASHVRLEKRECFGAVLGRDFNEER